jgi:hypothetical protein
MLIRWCFVIIIIMYTIYSAYCTPKLLDGLIASTKVKTSEGEGIGARSVAHSTSGVGGRGGALG